MKKYRIQIRNNDIYIRQFKNNVYWVVQNIDDHESLKRSANANLYQYIRGQNEKNVEVDAEIKKDYESQKKYLENSVNSLKKRLEKEVSCHREDKRRIMNENVKLIKDIDELRDKVNMLNEEYIQAASNKTLMQVLAKQN